MASTLSRRSRIQVKSGRITSTPGWCSSGNSTPQSTTSSRPSCSNTVMLRPISPRPPSGTIRRPSFGSTGSESPRAEPRRDPRRLIGPPRQPVRCRSYGGGGAVVCSRFPFGRVGGRARARAVPRDYAGGGSPPGRRDRPALPDAAVQPRTDAPALVCRRLRHAFCADVATDPERVRRPGDLRTATTSLSDSTPTTWSPDEPTTDPIRTRHGAAEHPAARRCPRCRPRGLRRRHPVAPDPAVAPHADQHRHRSRRHRLLPCRHRPRPADEHRLGRPLPHLHLAVRPGRPRGPLLAGRALARAGVDVPGPLGPRPVRVGAVQRGGGAGRPPGPRDPPRPQRPAPDVVGHELPRPRRAAHGCRLAGATGRDLPRRQRDGLLPGAGPRVVTAAGGPAVVLPALAPVPGHTPAHGTGGMWSLGALLPLAGLGLV